MTTTTTRPEAEEEMLPAKVAIRLAHDILLLAADLTCDHGVDLSEDPRVRRARLVLGFEEPGAPGAAEIADTTPSPGGVTAPTQTAEPLEAWTDGACSPNPGPGGWGWVTNEDGHRLDAVVRALDPETGSSPVRYDSGGEAASTNQRMEMQAAIAALMTIEQRPITIVSDSAYVVNAFLQNWWRGWYARDWINSKGEPVANRDLWEVLVPLGTATLPDGTPAVTFRKTKGHAGNPLNEAADRLAVAGRIQSAAAIGGAEMTFEDAFELAMAGDQAGAGKPARRGSKRRR